jgi:hypothetical protein
MAQQPAAGQSRYSSGLYALLREREEAAADGKGFVLDHGDGTNYQGSAQRLATLRTGKPVSLSVGDLPRRARVGLDCRSPMSRATVPPDGTIELYRDDGSEWAAENGL